MRREQSIVGNYYRLKPQARLDKIYTNFDNFPGIIADYEYEMAEWIKGNLAKARIDAVGDLGVRVQTSNFRRSITEDRAIENLEVERIIRETDLEDSSWDRIEDSDEIMRGLLEISLMRREYKRFNQSYNYSRRTQGWDIQETESQLKKCRKTRERNATPESTRPPSSIPWV